MSNFPEKLKSLRLKKGLTQEKLANSLNVSQNAVYNWENGKREPSLEMIRKISKILGVYMSDLIDDWSSIPIEQLKEDFSKNYDSYSEKADTYLVEKELDSVQGLKDFLAFHGVTIDADMNFIFDDSKEKYHVQDLGMLSEIAASQIKILIEKFSKYQK